ncbi:hypothetical protein GW17_00013049 [Ensete ventricosum]|nr:hypothetical protein GW17_00013049 [Ensete ventricosum]
MWALGFHSETWREECPRLLALFTDMSTVRTLGFAVRGKFLATGGGLAQGNFGCRWISTPLWSSGFVSSISRYLSIAFLAVHFGTLEEFGGCCARLLRYHRRFGSESSRNTDKGVEQNREKDAFLRLVKVNAPSFIWVVRKVLLEFREEMSASQQHKRGKAAKGLDVSEKVVVAVKASKEIPKTALVWALTHVVQPGDCIMLLVVVPPHSSGISHPNSVCLSLSLQYSFSLPFFFCRKLWGFPRFAGDCASGHRKSQSVGSHEAEPQFPRQLPSELDTLKTSNDTKDSQISIRGPAVTPTSSPEVETSFTATEAGTSSVSSSDPGTSPFFATETISAVKKEVHVSAKEIGNLDLSTSDSDSGCSSPARTNFQPWMADMFGSARPSSKEIQEVSQALDTKARISTAKALLDKFSKLDIEAGIGSLSYRSELNFSGNVREAISLSRKAPPGPPPLCSICQHKAPVFGKPPRWFSYSELELATGGFSQANFLAEGGFGSVHRGVLPDGQAIAVKQHKLASSQGDQEFCSENMLKAGKLQKKLMYIPLEWCYWSLSLDVKLFIKSLICRRLWLILFEQARPLLKEYAINELVDPRLGNHYAEHEVYCMLHAASFCIRRDPHARPRMSQVLRILEGDMIMDSNYTLSPGYANGNKSGRMWPEQQQQQQHSSPIRKQASEVLAGKKSYEALRTAWERERESIMRRC